MTRLVSLVATRQEIALQTHHDPPPIPFRNFDWSAVDDKTYDYDRPLAYGPNELSAINTLFDLLEAQ